MQTLLAARQLACALVMGLMLPAGMVSELRAQGLTSTGSMHAARGGHYATLLEDGRVLVVGGVSIDSPCDSNATAETYDPVKGAWSLIKDLPIAVDHGASVVRLPTGKVLISGGRDRCPGSARTAALFNPSTNTWAVTPWTAPQSDLVGPLRADLPADTRDLIARLMAPREGYTATRLKNGSVLVAGGVTARTPTAAVEVYIPEIPYEAKPFGGRGTKSTPAGTTIGVSSAVATNSNGHLFFTSSPRQQTHLFEYERVPSPFELGEWVREIGAGLLTVVHAVRVDNDNNIWALDSTDNAITKFDPEGRPLLRFFGPPKSVEGVDRTPIPSSEAAKWYTFNGPTDLTWDAAGDIFVADGGNSRILKYDKDGRFLKTVGSPGSAPDQMRTPHSMAADASGNVYVADGGNARIQVFDNNLNPKAVYDTVGSPWAICITSGAHQYLYSAVNPSQKDEGAAPASGEIYKMELDGTIVGKLGRPVNGLGGFRTLHSMQCRQESEIIAAEFGFSVVIIKVRP